MENFYTPIGDMKIEEMILYYDRPYIFSCRDVTDRIYMVHFVDEEEETEKWFMVPMSTARLEAVRTGKINLRTSILEAENGWIWEVNTPYDTTSNSGSAVLRLVSSLQENELPSDQAVLDLPDNRLPHRNWDVELEAKRAMRDVLLLSLNNGDHSQEIDALHLGNILVQTQSLVQALANNDGSSKGRMPKSIVEKSALKYTGDFAASVGIRLEAKYMDGTEEVLENALEKFILLMRTSSNGNIPDGQIFGNNKRVISRYKFFLNSLVQANISIKADWGSPKKGKYNAELSASQIQSTLKKLEWEYDSLKSIVEKKGELVGLVSDEKKDRHVFEFISNNGEYYKGTLANNLINKIEEGFSVRIPAHNVTVKLEELIEVSPYIEEDKVSYSLVAVDLD